MGRRIREKEILRRLGSGESVEQIAKEAMRNQDTLVLNQPSAATAIWLACNDKRLPGAYLGDNKIN